MLTPEQLIATEQEIAKLWEAGEIPYLTHLSGGNEEFMCNLFAGIRPTDWVFASHRAHYEYMLHGGTDLIEKVKQGKSMFLYGPRFIASAICAGGASIAAGVALGIKLRGGNEWVYSFIGDSVADEGHFWEAVKLVHDRNLPCTFIICDNGISCGVTKEQREVQDFQFPSCVIRHKFTPTYPHAGTGCKHHITFKDPRN